MSNKIALFIISAILFFLPLKLVLAEVVISEVKISPVAERFIKLYNNGSETIDLTGWYIQRKTATGATFGSLVSKTNFEGKTIGANSYFVISKTQLDNSDVVVDSLTLTESNTIQLKNLEGEVVDLVDWGNVAFWNAGGSQDLSISDDNEDENVVSPAPHTNSEPKPKVILAPSMKAKIVSSALVFAGQPFEMKTVVTGFSNENVVLGRAYWSFGDGESLEQINNFESFYHTYYYPGEYSVILEYYQKSYSKIPDVVSRMTIKVVPTSVVISKVGDARDFFIEISNSAGSDIDISNWVINANGKVFIFPKNSTILAKKFVTISSRVTGFTYGDQYNLKLFSSTGDLVFYYSAPVITTRNIVRTPSSILPLDKGEMSKTEGVNLNVVEEEILADNIPASVASSDIGGKSNSLRVYFSALILTVFVGGGASAVYFIRKKKAISNTGDDFKILDE